MVGWDLPEIPTVGPVLYCIVLGVALTLPLYSTSGVKNIDWKCYQLLNSWYQYGTVHTGALELPSSISLWKDTTADTRKNYLLYCTKKDSKPRFLINTKVYPTWIPMLTKSHLTHKHRCWVKKWLIPTRTVMNSCSCSSSFHRCSIETHTAVQTHHQH